MRSRVGFWNLETEHSRVGQIDDRSFESSNARKEWNLLPGGGEVVRFHCYYLFMDLLVLNVINGNT